MITMVVPTRDRAHTLRRVAPSYFSQEGVCEIIFVVDAGTDDTATVIDDVARRHSDIRTQILYNSTRVGASQSRNRGVAAATSDFILFCDDDEYLEPGYAQTCLRKLLETGAAAVSGRRVYMLDGEAPEDAVRRFGTGLRRTKAFRKTLCEYVNGANFVGDIELPFTNAVILTRRELLLRLPFDAHYARGNGYREETDFQMNLFVHGYRIVVTNDVHSIHLSPAQVRHGGQVVSRWRRVYWSVRYTRYFYHKYYKAYAARLRLRVPRTLALVAFAGFAVYREYLRPSLYRVAMRGSRRLRRRQASALADPRQSTQASAPPYEADVIILSWNRPDDVRAAIASALEQTGVSRRILVVDQGSEPQHVQALERFVHGRPDIVLRKLERNTGVAGGRNIATALGAGRYVVGLDSDAVFGDENALARAVAHMDAHPTLAAIGFRIENYFTAQNDELSWDYPGHRPEERFDTTRFIGAGHAIRRTAFEAAGGYDDRLFFCQEELDLCYRMLNLGFRIEYFPDVKVRHKVSPDQRVAWERGRYFFTVRNALYTSYKFGIPAPRLAVAAVAFLARGAFNGLGGSALRGVGAAAALCVAHARSAEDKSLYRLSPSTRRYIETCEPWRRESVAAKIRRQFTRLPHRA